MYNFTSTFILNDVKYVSNETPSDVKKEHNIIGLYDGSAVTALNFKYATVFNKADIYKPDGVTPTIYKRAGKTAVPAKAKFAFKQVVAGTGALNPGDIVPGSYRILIEYTLTDSAASTYNTASGAPSRIETYDFDAVLSDGTNIVDKVVNLINNTNARFDGELTASKDSNVLLLETRRANVDFRRVVLQHFRPLESNTFCAAGCNMDYYSTESAEITHASAGFGTYDWLIANLRLQTAANTEFPGHFIDERPVVGEVYTQYTIHKVVRDRRVGHTNVGSLVDSFTSTVFYVPTSKSAAFEAAFTALGGITIELITDAN